MDAKQLKNSILQWAIQGKLVPQIESEGTAEDLLKEIRAEKEKMVKASKLKKKNLEVKPIDEDDILFEIPSGWRWCRLGDICSFLSRGKSPSYSDIPNQYPVFAQKCNLKDGGISLAQARFLNPDTLAKWQEEFHLKTGDVLVNSTGTGTVCRTRLFNESYLGDYPFVVPDSHVSVVRTFDNVHSSYIYFLFNSKEYQDYWEDRLAGSTNQKELYIGTLNDTIVPLPPLSEQHRIVAKIEELMPLVEEYGKAQEQLEALNKELPEKLKKSVLQEAIMGKLVPQDPNEGTADELLAEIRKEKEKLVKAGKLKKKDLEVKPIEDDEVPFEIPEGWRWCRYSEIFNVINGDRGKNYPSKEKLSNHGIPFVSALNISNNSIASDDRLLCVSEKQYDLLGNGKINKGDTLVCIRGSLGKHGIYPFDKGAIASSLVICRSYFNQKCLSIYLGFYLDSELFRDEIKKYDNGTAQPNLAAKSLENFLFPLPPLAEQKRIVAKVEEVMREIEGMISVR